MNCQYCGTTAELVKGKVIFPSRPDLADHNFYECQTCHARCGCHPNTTKPMGTLANSELRTIRMHTHKHLDKLWEQGYMTRTEVYTWLAFALNTPFKFAHIGVMDKMTCIQTMRLAKLKLLELRAALEEKRNKNNGNKIISNTSN